MQHKVIHKYWLSISEPTIIVLPDGATPLTVGSQEGKVCIWIEHDDPTSANPVVAGGRKFVIRGTGWSYRKNELQDNYIGTAFVGDFVWHVFEVPHEN